MTRTSARHGMVWADWQTALVVCLGLAPVVLAVVMLWDFDSAGILRHNGKLLSWDFTSTWAGGVLGRQGRFDILYDHARYTDWLRGIFGPRLAPHEWLYPPQLLLLAVPLGTLPLPVSYAVWTLGTIALLLVAMRLGRFPAATLALTALSPALWKSVTLGQNGALTAACLVGGLALARQRPTLAGLLLGGLVLKPHLGLLAPVLLVATRQWRVLLTAALTALGLTVLTVLLFGTAPFRLFVTDAQPLMRLTLEAPWPTPYQMNGATVFMTARALGAGVTLAYGCQAIAALGSVATVWLVGRRHGLIASAIALTLALTFLVTPYAFTYDCVPLAVAALMLRESQGGWSATSALGWAWPGFGNFVSFLSVPLLPLVTLALAAAILARLHRSSQGGEDPVPAHPARFAPVG